MKPEAPIERLEATAYTVQTEIPEGDGTLAWDATTMVLVEATAGGTTGIGWTYGDAACADVANSTLAGQVTGRDALAVGDCWEAMVRKVRNAGRPGLVSMAISAVDLALWDLKARLLDVPLVRLLGMVHDAVPVYGSGGFTTYDDARTREQLSGWAHGQRIPRVKIKIGESWGHRVDRDVARVRLAREVIGPDVELYVDANGGYTRKQAIRVAEDLEDCDVRWYEEPVSSDDLDGLREVRDAVLPDVAAGEYGYDLFYFQRMVDANAVDCLQVDVTRCGGITEWRRAADVAASYGLEVSGHCAPNMHAHVAAATRNFRHLEWFHDHVRIESMFFEGGADPVEGQLRPGEAKEPGHGLTFRRADAEPYRAK